MIKNKDYTTMYTYKVLVHNLLVLANNYFLSFFFK